MMYVYRIAKTKYIHDISGYGAKEYGGRWNRPGVAVLYTSTARSLAMLELIIHFNSTSAFSQEFSFLCLEIHNDNISNIDQSLIPTSDLLPNDERLWKLTDEYLIQNNLVCMSVPSFIIPEEHNIILNPTHSEFSDLVKIKDIKPIRLDKRFEKIIQ